MNIHLRNTINKISFFIPPAVSFLLRWLKSKEFREIKKLKKLPRYRPSSSTLINSLVSFPDAASFLSQYKELFINNIYKFNTTNPQPFIIDCGANIGMSVLYFKSIYPNATIFAFEPDKEVFKYLEKNTKLNGVTLYNKGVWNEETTLTFYAEGADSGSIFEQKSSSKNEIKIETVRLKNILTQPVDFLKIDIEGSEYEVIKDCQNELKNVQNIFIEYHSFVNKEQHLDEIITILKQQGFRIHLQSDISSPSPFYEIKPYNNMDFSVNIFGYRI
jgi:FkbM family methyltransferase